MNYLTENLISYGALKKSKPIVEDFVRSYSIYHDLDPVDFLEYMDILMYLESVAYTIDESFEKPSEDCVLLEGTSITEEELKEFVENNKELSSLVSFLKNNNYYDDKIEDLVRNGANYWKIEKFLCNNENWKMGGQINEELLQRAMFFRSSDYRLLNRVIHKVRNKEYNELHFKFLESYELFVEILDDLLDYKEDASKKTFNICLMYEKLFGRKSRFMLIKFISNKEKEYHRLRDECLDDELIKKQNQKMKERLEGVIDLIPSEFKGYFNNSRWCYGC